MEKETPEFKISQKLNYGVSFETTATIYETKEIISDLLKNIDLEDTTSGNTLIITIERL